ncbi:MAG: zeta toxin family protein [Flavobacteriales bacterium]|nr:zeta toxin family protein [Flavobacteriales bacterium]
MVPFRNVLTATCPDSPYHLSSFLSFASRSGLLNRHFTRPRLVSEHRFAGSEFQLLRTRHLDHFAQLIAAYLCDRLVKQGIQFSFETVFSHSSKLALMRRAKVAGFKVYLYFIATNSAEINVDRVRIRVDGGGHHVPREKIVERFGRSLKQLLPAIDLCYHAFVFDNSTSFDGASPEPLLFAEMKQVGTGRSWAWDLRRMPDWFIRDYLIASRSPQYLDIARQALARRGS